MPDTPAAGRVHGKKFAAQRMVLDGGKLTLRTSDFPPEAGFTIDLKTPTSEELAEQTITFAPDSSNAPGVSLRYKNAQGREMWQPAGPGFALHVEFGQIVDGHLSGRIYLCTADPEKSYVAGAFNAEILKPKR